MLALAHLYDMVPSPELLLVLELLDPVALAGLAVAVWIRPSLVSNSILFSWLFTLEDQQKLFFLTNTQSRLAWLVIDGVLARHATYLTESLHVWEQCLRSD